MKLAAFLILLAAPAFAEIEVSQGFARATLPNAPVAGGYVTVHNTSDQPDRLLAVEAPFARRSEIHEMFHSGDIMRMRPVEGVDVPAGATVALSPHGHHLMFMGLSAPLVQGDTVDITLVFGKAGRVNAPLLVKQINARSFEDDGSGHTHIPEVGGHSH